MVERGRGARRDGPHPAGRRGRRVPPDAPSGGRPRRQRRPAHRLPRGPNEGTGERRPHPRQWSPAGLGVCVPTRMGGGGHTPIRGDRAAGGGGRGAAGGWGRGSGRVVADGSSRGGEWVRVAGRGREGWREGARGTRRDGGVPNVWGGGGARGRRSAGAARPAAAPTWLAAGSTPQLRPPAQLCTPLSRRRHWRERACPARRSSGDASA